MIESIKKNTTFLAHDVNSDEYSLVKAQGSSCCHNFKKSQIYDTQHNSSTIDYFIQNANSYSSFPFGQSNFYIDFNLPSFELLYYQFVLRFSLTNSTAAWAQIMPTPLMIEKVDIMKNGNTIGVSTYDYAIMNYNANKYYNENRTGQLGVLFMNNNNGYNSSLDFKGGVTGTTHIELPISLNRSYFLSSKIQDQLVLRVYFKSLIVYDAIQDSQVQLSNVQLILRMKQISNQLKNYLYKQPKLSHIFQKQLVFKYNLNSLVFGQSYSINLSGINQVVSSILLFISNPPTDIKHVGGNEYHICKYQIADVHISDATNQNLLNYKINSDYNKYVMQNHFKNLNQYFVANTASVQNLNEIVYINFSSGETNDDSFNGVYSGGYDFNASGQGDYKLNFNAVTESANNVIVNLIVFTSSLIEVDQNGNLLELLS